MHWVNAGIVITAAMWSMELSSLGCGAEGGGQHGKSLIGEVPVYTTLSQCPNSKIFYFLCLTPVLFKSSLAREISESNVRGLIESLCQSVEL